MDTDVKARTAARRWLAARRLRRAWAAARRCRATAGLSPDLALVLDRGTARWEQIAVAQLTRRLDRPVRVGRWRVDVEDGVIVARRRKGGRACSAWE
jgi:hypothetical protein